MEPILKLLCLLICACLCGVFGTIVALFVNIDTTNQQLLSGFIAYVIYVFISLKVVGSVPMLNRQYMYYSLCYWTAIGFLCGIFGSTVALMITGNIYYQFILFFAITYPTYALIWKIHDYMELCS